jgi:hypothetical protein
MLNRVASLCLVSVLLSACGSGGGGGSSSPPPAPPSPPPPPPFALTEANAVQAAAYALAPIEQMIPAGSLALNGAAFLRAYGGTQYTLYCGAQIPIVVTYTDRDANSILSIGDVVDVPSVDCNGLHRKLTLTVTQLGPTLDQLAGRLEVDIQTPTGMQIVGAFDVSLTYMQPDFTWRLANVVVAVTQAGTTQTVRVTSSEITFTPTGYAFSVTGGSVDSEHLGGSYTFATTTAFTSARRRLPSAGELLLTASAGSRARVTPPATPGNVEEAVEYAVSAAGSTTFASTQQTMWTAIIRGGLFGWAPNVAPTLTNLLIQPSNPSPGANLWVSYFAQDANGDPLETTIEWRRDGTVVGTGSFLNANIARNDVISVTVTVSDGRLSATATASITIGNPPPQLTLTLTPSQPNSSVDLVAAPDVYEPDGDPVALTYEWLRDGTVIPNQTADTLPASETTRDQLISVRVQASDGTTTVEATASVTILDSPPRLSVASPPTTVVHGAPVTFTATVSDADGDPVDHLDFVLAYGPAGMTVDPDTGVVSWTAGGPMFDRTMDFNWGITLSDSSATLATGTLQVTDSERDYPMMRFGMKNPVWPAGLSIGDFDEDGDNEMLIMNQRGLFELESDGTGAYRQPWAYPYALDIDTQNSYQTKNSLAAGDVDSDGMHEIFASSGRTLTKLDGVERRPVARWRLAEREACSDLALADLDKDGATEIVCLANADMYSASARILVLHASDLSLRHEYPQADYGRALTVGNIDGDAALELVTAGGYVFDGGTLANQWLLGSGFGIDVDTGDVDGDRIDEIVGAHDWEAVRVYRSGQQAPIAEVARSDLDSLLVADVTGDPPAEIIVGDGQFGNVTIYGYNTTTPGLDIIDQIDSQQFGVTSMGVGDIDGDAAIELVWGARQLDSGSAALVVAERTPTLEVEWTNTVLLDGPFKGGQLAGSGLEPRAPLFLSGTTRNRFAGAVLVRMPSDDGDLEVSSQLTTGNAGHGVLVTADYDNDGEDEVYLATGGLSGEPLFRVYDFFGDTNVWSSGTAQGAAISVTDSDVTGDGRPELIGMTWNGIVYVHDVFSQSLIWQGPTLNEGREALVADVDGDPDGQPEIVAVTRNSVHVYRHNPQPTAYVLAATYQANREIIDAAVGDTDGDGETEILLLLGDYFVEGGIRVVRLDNDLQELGSFTLLRPALSLAVEHSPTPRKNLLIGTLVGPLYSAYDGTLAIVDARTGALVFQSPQLIGAIQRNSIHYVVLPGEAVPRMSFGTSAAMYLTR